MMYRAVYESPELPNPFDLAGVTAELLLNVVERGEAMRDQATALDAPTRGPLNAYFEKVRALREGLIPHGWDFNNDNNYCTVVSPCGGHAIAVAVGTRGTGEVHPTPETAREMGPITASIVATNKLQLTLFDRFDVPESETTQLTWFLLSRRVGGSVYLELSLPDGATENGVVCTWRQRYLLEPIDLTPEGLGRKNDDDDAVGDVDVPVSIRS